MSEAHTHDHDHDHDEPHAVPLGFLTLVFVALMALTWVTVAATWVNLGELNIYIAMGIAFVKATLVGAYFMHLRWDSPLNGVILIGSLLFVTLFIAFASVDKGQYKHNDRPPQGALVSESE